MINTNLVTGFWNIRPDRDESVYLDSFKNVLSIPHNISVFIPKVYEPFVLEARQGLLEKTDINIVELEHIKDIYFTKYWHRVEKIRTDPEWINSTNWLKKTPQCFSEWYNPIVMSKVFFVEDAHNKNIFDSETYIWIDAGITQHIPKEFVCEDSINNFSDHIKTAAFTAFEYKDHPEVHGFKYEGFVKYTQSIPNFVCRATIFGFNKNYVSQFVMEYRDLLYDTLSRGYLGTEESIFTLMAAINFGHYNLYNLGAESMPVTFLQNMKEGHRYE